MGSPWPSIIAFDFAMVGITLAFLLLRLYVRTICLRKFEASDAFVCLAWGLLVAAFVGDLLFWKWGFDEHRETMDPAKKVISYKLKYVQPTETITCMYCVKMSFLFLYRQIFPPAGKLRRALRLSFVFVIVVYLTTIGFNLLNCLPHPINSNWSLDNKVRCVATANKKRYYYSIGMNIITDLVIYSLPFCLLPRLYRNRSTSRRKIYWSAAVMSIGLVSIICSFIRIIGSKIWHTGYRLEYLGSAEPSTAVLVACCPPLRYLFTRRRTVHEPDPKCPAASEESPDVMETRTAWRFWRMTGHMRHGADNTVETRDVINGTTMTAASDLSNGMVFTQVKGNDTFGGGGGGLAPVPRRHSSVTAVGITRSDSKPTVQVGISEKDHTRNGSVGFLDKVKRKQSKDGAATGGSGGGNTFGGASQASYNAGDDHELDIR